MTKEILQKIYDGKALSSEDMTTDEKNQLYEAFERYGMVRSTTNRRFFKMGFLPWELLGVSQLRDEFLVSASCCVDDNGTEDPGSRGYGYVLTLGPNYDDSKFYNMLSDLRIVSKFCSFMAERGMASHMTVRTRFKANDWKAWELKGIKAILEELYAE